MAAFFSVSQAMTMGSVVLSSHSRIDHKAVVRSKIKLLVWNTF